MALSEDCAGVWLRIYGGGAMEDVDKGLRWIEFFFDLALVPMVEDRVRVCGYQSLLPCSGMTQTHDAR